ncbi:MAG: extracellular solute-binding protein [Deltaproteobacteria bacterium]|nr:MAG: extracellular solute-binding protein [Deltaproteobacteria bacterium]
MMRKMERLCLSVFLAMCFLFGGFFHDGEAQASPYAKYAGTTLVVNFPSHPYYEYAIKLLPEFTKETGIKVEIDKIEYMKMRDKQLLEMAKPKGDYDLVSYVVMWKTEYVSKGLLAPLAPFFTNPALTDPSYDSADIVPAYLQTTGMAGGRKIYLPGPTAACYGIPFGSETSMFAYRKDIFQKHGWKVPQTYDEMLKLCRLVKEKEPEMGGLTMRGEAGHQVQHGWLNHLTPYGGSAFDDNWEPAFHKEPSIKAIKAMIEIVKTGPPGITTFAYGAMSDAFLLGKAAMYLDSTAMPGLVRDPNKSKIMGKVGFGLHPKAVKHSTETGGFGIAIPANSAKKEAAFLLLQWFTSKAQDQKIARLGGMPNRISTLKDPGMQKEYPEFNAILENLKYANPDWRPLIPEWPEISMQYVGIALHEAITGKKTPEKAMTDVVEPVRKIMEKAGYYSWKK